MKKKQREGIKSGTSSWTAGYRDQVFPEKRFQILSSMHILMSGRGDGAEGVQEKPGARIVRTDSELLLL